jgi:KaiC/GvpD/RAD55 family RecA-like ATPase
MLRVNNKKSEKIFLPTGIEHLDSLLCANLGVKERGGFLIRENEKSETPIILIEGDTGTGKTTLSMQIVNAAARSNEDYDHMFYMQKEGNKECWEIYYYSLEQTATALVNLSKKFGFLDAKVGDSYYKDESEIPFINSKNEKAKKYKIHFCHFSPKPITSADEKDVFEQRMGELNNAVLKILSNKNENKNILFVIDCLNALSAKKLDRSDLYRLFSIFRKNKIPALFTLEYPSQQVYKEAPDVASDCARYLADIVISLTRETPIEHNQFYLEIIKSRVCRQALGKHLYKIRTIENEMSIKTDNRKGIVVYPSIHYILSRVREDAVITSEKQKDIDDNTKNDFVICNETKGTFNHDFKDIGLIINSSTISSNSSIAIVGPDGTHKLALGLNFAFGVRVNNYRKIARILANKNDKILDIIPNEGQYLEPKVLIINFGSSSDLDFSGIAWTDFNKNFSKIEKDHTQDEGNKIKFWHTNYQLKKNSVVGNNKPSLIRNRFNAVVTSFKVGQLTPEECFDVIEKRLRKEELLAQKDEYQKIFPFTSAIICNTAELCTGFPLLKKDPLFLPSLIDLFEAHRLVTIGLGIENEKDIGNQEANFALLARADYRIKLSHQPKVEELSKDITCKIEELINKKDDKEYSNLFEKYKNRTLKTKNLKLGHEEQYVSLIIDNVTGRHYSRKPRWLSVSYDKKRPKDKNKILHCEVLPFRYDEEQSQINR